jgi:hypothetical protein
MESTRILTKSQNGWVNPTARVKRQGEGVKKHGAVQERLLYHPSWRGLGGWRKRQEEQQEHEWG